MGTITNSTGAKTMAKSILMLTNGQYSSVRKKLKLFSLLFLKNQFYLSLRIHLVAVQ